MRKRIAKRKRKSILRFGGEVKSEGWIRERGWRRQDCGYRVTVLYKGWHIYTSGKDELVAFKLALEEIENNIHVWT